MKNWYDEITLETLAPVNMTLPEFAESYTLQHILYLLSNQRVSLSASNGTYADTFSVLTQDGNIAPILEHLMVDMLHMLINENPEFVKEYVTNHINGTLQRTALNKFMEQIEKDNPSEEGLTVKWNPNRLKNKDFNFWWDYEEDEIVVFAESNECEAEICRIIFDGEEERVDAEAEAENLIKSMYKDEINIGEFIESDRSTVTKDDLGDGLLAWFNFDMAPESDYTATTFLPGTASVDDKYLISSGSVTNNKVYIRPSASNWYVTTS